MLSVTADYNDIFALVGVLHADNTDYRIGFFYNIFFGLYCICGDKIKLYIFVILSESLLYGFNIRGMHLA